MPGEAGRAEIALEESRLTPNSELVLVQSDDLSAGDPAFDSAVADATERLRALSSVTALSSPAAGGGQVSVDGHSALIEFEIRGDSEQAEARVDASLAATAAAQRANPGMRVEQFGDTSANKALEAVFAEDLKKAETTSLPITLIILVLAFGALVAALVPLLIAFSAVLATLGLLALPSQLVPMDPNVSAVVVLRRPRGRRRLLALLPAPRARGARGPGARQRRRLPPPPQPRAGRCSSPARP